MSFFTSSGAIVAPLTAGGVAYGTGSQAKITSAGTAGQVLTSNGAGVPTFTTLTIPSGGITYVTKTANYTAVNGDFLLCNTSAGAFTITLPASPTLNDQVYFQDSTGSFSTNALTIDPGSKNIMGSSGVLVTTLANAGFGLFYNGTQWRIW
jgi:hypothetical protein